MDRNAALNFEAEAPIDTGLAVGMSASGHKQTSRLGFSRQKTSPLEVAKKAKAPNARGFSLMFFERPHFQLVTWQPLNYACLQKPVFRNPSRYLTNGPMS